MTYFTTSEVAKHASKTDCWIIIDSKVYNVTPFLEDHPGGARTILRLAGKDASKDFHALHNASVLITHAAKFLVGEIKSAATSTDTTQDDAEGPFGSPIPYAEPAWYGGKFKSPYYKATHRRFRAKMRRFVDTELRPYCHEWDEANTYPPELHEKAYKAGIYGAIWPVQYGGTPPEDFDSFHDLIMVDELARCAAGGVLWSCFFSFGISLPPILKSGSQYLKDWVAKDVITGKKIMALAVTEPYGGSDVANIKTTAVKEGDYYIVTGEKKFITAGMKAHYFTTAVRTGGPGISGVSLLLIDAKTPGVTVRRIPTQGWWISNTAFIAFDNVKVPVKNLIGQENRGFQDIMENFNHERWTLAATSNRYARVCLEDAIAYARTRTTFGKRLIDHQTIRHKLATMAGRTEALQSHIEQITYQMKSGVPDTALAGPIALLKVDCTKNMELCAREASQILGGASFVRGGHGERIERLYREVRVNAIGGGSEEILMDLGMKMAKL